MDAKAIRKALLTSRMLAERPKTLALQRQALKQGRKAAVLYPHGTKEGELPEGHRRIRVAEGVIHHDPTRIRASDIIKASREDRLGEVLGLGPHSKADIAGRMAQGEPQVNVVARKGGEEALASAATPSTAHAQAASIRASAPEGSKVGLEHPAVTLAKRVGKAGGGPLPWDKIDPSSPMILSDPHGFAKHDMPANAIHYRPGSFEYETNLLRHMRGSHTPRRLWHGTFGHYTQFSRTRGNPFADLGKGYYFTDSPWDARENYANPFTPEQLVKQRQWLEDHGKYVQPGDPDWERHYAEARRGLGHQHNGFVMPAHVAIRKPFIIGGNDETYFGGEKNRDLRNLLRSMQHVAHTDPTVYDPDHAEEQIGNLLDTHKALGGTYAGDLRRDAKNKIFSGSQVPGTLYSNESELFRQSLEHAGYDGIIDRTVPSRFGKMQGVQPTTNHYIAFHDNQIKSALGNRGTFDPDRPHTGEARGGRIGRAGGGKSEDDEIGPWNASGEPEWNAKAEAETRPWHFGLTPLQRMRAKSAMAEGMSTEDAVRHARSDMDPKIAAALHVAGQVRKGRLVGGRSPVNTTPTITGEVAPGRTYSEKQQKRWEKLHPKLKAEITGRMIDEFMPRWMKDTGITGDLIPMIGGYEGNTNPSFHFRPHNPEHFAAAARGLGKLFSQDSMVAAHEHPFEGSEKWGLTRVHLPQGLAPEEIHDIYNTLYDKGLALGHTTDPVAGHMDILTPGDAEAHAHQVDEALGGKHNVSFADTNIRFPSHGEDYDSDRPDTAGTGASPPYADDHIQRQAAKRLETYLQRAQAQGWGHEGDVDLEAKTGRSTVEKPTGKRYPGIYGDPRELAAEAASRVAKESPWLKKLWGVNRAEMYERGAHRKGNMEPQLPFEEGDVGRSDVAHRTMTPRNRQRLQDLLHEGSQHEGLRHGMMAWYYMDPVFHRMQELVGHHKAIRDYNELNSFTGMASPGSPVLTEINRGLAARYAHRKGRFHEFVEHGGTKVSERGHNSFPADLKALKPHAYHKTAHAVPMSNYVKTGDISDMGSVKVPTYIGASGVPETGFQTRWAVPDAHYTRFSGMSDTRSGKTAGASMKAPEYKAFAPWWRDEVAGPMGMEAVPGQALTWGAGSGATGVKTAIGAPKLELLTQHILGAAKRYGTDPYTARDKVLKGEIFQRGGSVGDALATVARKVR